MDLQKLRALNLYDGDDLKTFNKILNEDFIKIFEPASFIVFFIKGLSIGSEELSFKVWIMMLNRLGQSVLNKNANFWALTNLIITALQELKIETILFMKNIRKWHQLFFAALSDRKKITFYAMHQHLENSCKKANLKLDFVSFAPFLEYENIVIKSGVTSYQQYVLSLFGVQ